MRSFRNQWVLLATAIAALLGADTAEAQQSVDVLIKGGMIYDGSDAKPYIGDVAVEADQIVYVGPHAGVSAKRIINATGMIVSPGFIDGHAHSDHFLGDANPAQRQNAPWLTQGVSTVLIGIDGNGTPNLKDLYDGYRKNGIGTNVVSYVGFGDIRKRVIGQDARAPTMEELEKEKQLTAKGMCEGAIGLSAGLFYAPQSYAKTDEVIALAKEAAMRGGIYDTHQRDESSYSIGLLNSTKEVLQIGREANIPVVFSHIKALGVDMWGKSTDVIKLIEDARASGQNVTANQYPWLASSTGLDAALVPRWAQDGGYAAMIKRLDDPAQSARLVTEMTDNLRRRGGPHSILLLTKGFPWSGKYLDEAAADMKMDPVAAANHILHQGERILIASFSMSQEDVDNFMKQPWVVTSSDGVDGHPRMYASFSIKYAEYVKKRHVISLPFFIRHATGLAADYYMIERRGYLKSGYYADVLVFDPDKFAPRADYVNPDLPSVGVTALLVNGKVAVENDRLTGALSGRPLPHTPVAGTCQ